MKQQKYLKPRLPRLLMIDNQQYVSFKDVFINLLINSINQTDYELLMSKANTIQTKPMSPKHRKRLARQIKRKLGG